jgi:pimeloyl-ACP methyl ester carboxylesterase
MEHKYIAVEGLNLAHIEKNPEAAQTIFFIHGNSGSSLTWSKQLESVLLSDFRLIAFDLPGHGFSDDSPNPDLDYSPIRLGQIMADAVSRLAVRQPYILIGFSLGTNIIGEMLYRNLTPAGIVLVSSCVINTVSDLQTVFLPNENANNFFSDSVSAENLAKLARDCFYLPDTNEMEKFKTDFQKTKVPFRSTLMKKAGEGAVNDEIELLEKIGLSILTIFGNEDKIVNVDYLDTIPLVIWQNAIYKLPQAGHFVHIDQAEKVNQLISDYVAEMFTIGRA